MSAPTVSLAELEATLLDLNDTTNCFKGMLYGASGVGKSVNGIALLQQLVPPDKLILYIDSKEGWVSLKNHPTLLKRIKRIQYENITQLNAIVEAIELKQGGFAQIGGIFFDEFSSIATTDLDEVTRHRASKDKGKDPDTPLQPDYNTASHRARKVLEAAVALTDVHVVITAHERSDKTPVGGVKTSPAFPPKLAGDIRNPLHMVAYITVDDITDSAGKTKAVRSYQVHPTKKVDAKTRVGGLAPVVSFGQLVKGIQAWLASGLELAPEKSTVVESDKDKESTEEVDGYPEEKEDE